MLQSNSKIKKLSMFLIASFFLSFLAGEVNAIKGTCDRNGDDRRTCHRRQYRHHGHHHRRHHHHRHHCFDQHNHNHHQRHHHRRHVERPDEIKRQGAAVPVKKGFTAQTNASQRKTPPQRSRFGLRRQAKIGDRTIAHQWRKSLRGREESKRMTVRGREESKRVSPVRRSAKRK